MADKKEVSILLLGIVAILAIVGLVLLFTSPAATGRAWQPPAQLPPTLEMPAGPGETAVGGQYNVARGGQGNAVYITEMDAALLPTCPNGRLRTRMQGNLPYEATAGQYCQWYYCPGLEGSNVAGAQPMLACAPIPR